MPAKKKKRAVSGTKRKNSPLMRKYNALKRKKSQNCNGKATAADVRRIA